jgi:glycolate oxidase iron-sulfur subunit
MVPPAAAAADERAATLGAFRGPDSPSLEGLRACVHCGICLPQCPTYRVLGEEMDSPRGRIYLMRAAAEGRIDITESFARHLDLCLGCRACETACPSGVPFGQLLEATRAQIARARPESRSRRLLTGFIFGVFTRPERLGILMAAARIYQRSGLQTVARASGLLGVFPRLAALDGLLGHLRHRQSLPEFIPAVGRRRGRVGLLTGCVQRHLFSSINHDTARLLSRAGYDVVIPASQGCCGAIDLHAGRLEAVRARARALAAAFPDDLDLIVTNAAGCGSAMKEYGHWTPGDVDVERLAARTRDVTEVLADSTLSLGSLEMTVTYHDACHLAHGQRVRAEPRALLRRIPGITLVELRESDLCCGSAGIYNLLEPAVADRLLELKIARIVETGARVVATGNPGCLLQIAKGARARGLDLEILHPVELLARAAERYQEAGRNGA